MQDCASQSDFTAIFSNWTDRAVEPASEPVAAFFIEYNFIILKVVADNCIGSLALPLEAAHSLIAAFTNDSKFRLVLKLHDNFRS